MVLFIIRGGKIFGGVCKSSIVKKNIVSKREYQINLLNACAQENSLVVIPTGLGKTIIALFLSVLKMDKFPEKKVYFLAPTKPLVDQHFQTFSNLMNLPSESLCCITGSIQANKREDIYKSSSIFFMTPQILQNDLIKGIVSLSEASLIIFDECHRAVGNYSYVFIAEEYFKTNHQGLILGMTASPGKNREKIEEILKNLHLTNVEIKTEEDADVRPYIFSRKEKWIDVQLPEQLIKVINTLDKMMKEIAKELNNHGFLEGSKEKYSISKTQLFAISKEIDQKINSNRDSDAISEFFYLKKLVANGIRISHMTDLLEAQGIGPLIDYFEKNIKEIKENNSSKSAFELFNSKEITEIYDCLKELTDNHVIHPKMTVLKDLIEFQLINNPSSRILVFAHFRDTVSSIIEFIVGKEDDGELKQQIIRPERFVGQAKKGDEAGLSQKEQLEILQKFKKGEFNVLVATSVAEEGLDIDECDLVIFFDIVPSEIRSIQRRGRTGRKKEGKIFMLKSAGTKEDAFYWIERRREKEMKKILKEIKDLKIVKSTNKNFINPFDSSLLNKGLDRFIGFDKNTPDQSLETQEPKEKFDIYKKIENVGENIIENDNNIDSLIDEEFKEYIDDMEEDLEDIDLNDFDINESPIPPENSTPNKGKIISDMFIGDKMEKKVSILVDNRELRSNVVLELRNSGCHLQFDNYFAGDYIVSTRCAIERKTIPDFVSSLKDGRIFNEIIKLKESFEIGVLILEGSISEMASLRANAMYGALTSIILKFKLSILNSSNIEQTADLIISLAKKEQFDEGKSVPLAVPKLPDSDKGKIETILSTFPKLNVIRARDLLNKFGTLQNIFNASVDELMEVQGIGKIIAHEIVRIVKINYLDSNH